jgi:hypothetical protein
MKGNNATLGHEVARTFSFFLELSLKLSPTGVVGSHRSSMGLQKTKPKILENKKAQMNVID